MGTEEEFEKGNDETFIDEEDIVSITTSDGTTIECSILCVLDTSHGEFALVAKLDELLSDDESAEVEMMIFSYKVGDDGQPVLANIDDDDLYSFLEQEFRSMIDNDDESGHSDTEH